MHKSVKPFLLFLACSFSMNTPAQESAQSGTSAMSGEELVQYHFCYSCHESTEVLLGPPWQAISARHSPRKDIMVSVLAEKIRLGGGGNWGVVPMVPNEHVPEEDALKIAQWILDLSPDGN